MRMLLRFIPAIIWFIISTILLTLPGSALPQESIFDKIPLFDKWVHLGMFALLVFLMCMALSTAGKNISERRQLFKTLSLAALGYGILMEIVQHFFIPLRSFDVFDIVADALGAGLGLLLSYQVYIKK